MSRSTYIKGCRPPDAKWSKMKAAYDACQLAGVAVPDEVEKFFNGEPPDPSGVEVALMDYGNAKKRGIVTAYRDDAREGYEVDVTKLPKDVTLIRFVNSW